MAQTKPTRKKIAKSLPKLSPKSLARPPKASPPKAKRTSLKKKPVEADETTTRKPTFYDRVYALVELVPRGKVTTYGAIAETLGMKGSSRLVGHALGVLPDESGIPAHRVINRIGALSGAHKFGGYDRMRSLLVREKVTFKAEIVDMKRHFWHPRELEG